MFTTLPSRCALLFVISWMLIGGLPVIPLTPNSALAAEQEVGDQTKGENFDGLTIVPAEFTLRGKAALQRLLVSGTLGERIADVTNTVTFSTPTPNIIRIDADGVVRPLADGVGIVAATLAGKRVEAKVVVQDAAADLPVSFQLDIQPILAARGCSGGPCHGKARGQNGFQLSLLGFDSDFDFSALTQQSRGRRIFPAAPERSLLLRKATAAAPHGGGKRLDLAEHDYATLLRWVASGMPRHAAGESTLASVTVSPMQRFLRPGEEQQLLVTAHYADGSQRDVTGQTTFQSNESAVVAVSAAGKLTAGPIPGEAAIMARYMGQIAICRTAIPLANPPPPELYAALPRYNFIDEHAWAKQQSLGITPSAPAGDEKFLRRVYIDIIGRLPTPEESRAFLESRQPGKRPQLVDALLERPEYADHWATKWSDLLRPNPYRVGIKAVFNYDNWIRQSFRENKPYDQFVRELVAAQGSTWRNGAATLFRDRRSPDEVTTLVSQLFLGIRLECTKCHHHPSEKWEQADFYRFAAYFSRVGHKGTGLSPPISGGEEMIYVTKSGSVKHPRTGKVMPPEPLFGEAAKIGPDDDPRAVLANWMTSPQNDYFVQVMVNRVWADLMGRGLVEPVDDLRATNPPSNGPLLQALGEEFRRQKYDIKQLIRTITNSYVYSLSSLPSDRNVSDTRNFSRHYRQRLNAEVMHDAICDITEVPTAFAAMPPNARAAELWTRRVGSLFLDTFGRPDPNQDPPCERTGETTVTQALHLMNAPALHAKVTSDAGRAARLAKSDRTESEVIEELYLAIYARLPSAAEKANAEQFLAANKNRRQALEDLMWAMLNTPEFVFKD